MNVHKGISPNVNVIARLEIELSYNDVAVNHVSHYVTRIPTGVYQCVYDMCMHLCACINTCVYVYIYPAFPTQVRCATRSVFEWSTAGLNSECWVSKFVIPMYEGSKGKALCD